MIIKFAYPIAKLYWFIFRPKTFGVKCIIKSNDKILLVRHSYGTGWWSFPGGGIKKGELPEQAVEREIKEELGIELNNIEYIDKFINTGEYKIDTVHCFVADARNENIERSEIELKEADWFLLTNLPKPFSPVTQKVLSLWNQGEKGS